MKIKDGGIGIELDLVVAENGVMINNKSACKEYVFTDFIEMMEFLHEVLTGEAEIQAVEDETVGDRISFDGYVFYNDDQHL